MPLFKQLEKIVGTEDREVEIELPEERINLLSLKILRRAAERRGKILKLKATGPRGKRLVAQLGGLPEGEEGDGSGLAMPVWRLRFKRFRPSFGAIKRVGLVSLLLFGISLFMGGGAYWVVSFLPRAEITLTLRPIPMTKEFSVTADPEAAVIDASAGVIPGVSEAVRVEGQKTVPATGTATVGEKATGTVRFISSNVTESVHISQGTRIVEMVTGQKLAFITVAAVDVPPGDEATTVGVIAEKIGAAYNLEGGKLFEVEGGKEKGIAAKNDTAFSGGESHQVTVVSSADQAKVLEELKAELLAEGKGTLESQTESGWVVIQEAIKEEELERSFLQNIGDQADTVGLTLKLELTTVAYKEADLEDFVAEALVDLIPDGYEIYPGEMAIDVINPEFAGGVLNFSAKVAAQVIPQLDLATIKSDLAGRNIAGAQEYLASLSNVVAYELRLWPNLPEWLRKIPRSTGRIRIELRTESE